MSSLYDIIYRVKKMQINRLFEIVYLLLERKTITAKELANRFEVSTRTIYRDVEILSNAKIPIYATKGKGGGISLLDNFVLDKSMVSEEEQNEILFGLQSLKELKAGEGASALEKMGTLFKKKEIDWICIDFSGWGNEIKEKEQFEEIKQAILRQQVLKIEYYASDGKVSKREMEPMQLVFKDKSWYLKAYCKLKEDFRLFKMTRIRNLEVMNEKFERREMKQNAENQNKDNRKVPNIKIVNLKLKVDASLAYRVCDEFREKNITKDRDGNFLIEVQYPEDEWVYGYLLSFGDKIEILEPSYVKEQLAVTIEKMREKYQKNSSEK